MKATKYDYEDGACPELPYLDVILQKFDKAIVVTDDGEVVGYSGFVIDDDRCKVNSFWAKKRAKDVYALLLKTLKTELNFNTYKRIGVDIDETDTKLIDIFNSNDWYVWVPNVEKEITAPARGCFMLNIPPSEIEKIKLTDAEYRVLRPKKK